MHAIADTIKLVDDGVISKGQATTIEQRARESMMVLAINMLLGGGILAASGGLIFWLADALYVALCGSLALVIGVVILMRNSSVFWMFGNAAFLVGAGMLIGGASIELMHTYERIAGLTMFSAGGAITAGALWAMAKGSRTNRFVSGAVVLMAGAAHLFGLFFHLDQLELTGTPVAMAHLYAAAVMIIAGLVTNVRVITALAIVPFPLARAYSAPCTCVVGLGLCCRQLMCPCRIALGRCDRSNGLGAGSSQLAVRFEQRRLESGGKRFSSACDYDLKGDVFDPLGGSACSSGGLVCTYQQTRVVPRVSHIRRHPWLHPIDELL